jgi:hypothetical protein
MTGSPRTESGQADRLPPHLKVQRRENQVPTKARGTGPNKSVQVPEN